MNTSPMRYCFGDDVPLHHVVLPILYLQCSLWPLADHLEGADCTCYMGQLNRPTLRVRPWREQRNEELRPLTVGKQYSDM